MIRIGCQSHSSVEWSSFDNTQIDEMNPRALDWWRRNRAWILACADACWTDYLSGAGKRRAEAPTEEAG